MSLSIIMILITIIVGFAVCNLLRQIQREILISQRNRKSEERIYKSKKFREKFSLRFIEGYLKYNIKIFRKWNLIYTVSVCVELLLLITEIVLCIFMYKYGVIFSIAVVFLNILVFLILRLCFFNEDRHSVYWTK